MKPELVNAFLEGLQLSKGEQLRPLIIDSKIMLRNYLSMAGVRYWEWRDNPRAKNIDDLMDEIEHDETTFVYNLEGALYRKVSKAVIDVIRRNKHGVQERLYEEIFDGTNWVRRNEDPSGTPGLKEKAKLRENPMKTAIRGIGEEMKLTELTEDELIGLIHLPISEKSKQTKESDGYPGLNTIYNFDFFIFELPEERYQSEYEFEEGKRRMRLLWEKIV